MSTIVPIIVDGMESRNSNGQAERLYGKYPGIVLDNTAQEDQAHRGELLVEIHGILEEDSSGQGQRPLQAIAKPCFTNGFFFIPEIDTHIWIEFAAGEISQPIWTGVWYPNDKAPLSVDDESPSEFQKIIRTASGHLLQIDDTEGEEQIFLKHMSGTQLSIDPDGHVYIQHADGATKFEIKEEGMVNIECTDMKIQGTLEVDGEVTINEKTMIKGDLEVGDGTKTTISGNEIKGG